jgi:NADH dehydrogenase [ubiquinone] 1 alpha subcomplex assembly factor 1
VSDAPSPVELRPGDWAAIDDVVMGGRSRSAIAATPEGTAVFRGTVSDENNGGFASVRSRPLGLDLSGREGLRLRVRGDGKRYKLCVKNDADFDGVVYQSAFETEPMAWQTVELPFSRFVPTFRGRRLDAEPPLDPSRIATLGLMLSDRQLGPFRLEIALIASYGGSPRGR